MLIILPDHLRVSGITTWAIHAVRGLRERSIPAGLIVHTQVGESLPDFLEPYVWAQLRDAKSIQRLHGNLDELVPFYLDAIRRMHERTGQPVVVSPNLHGDCYGAIATIARDHPGLLRLVSWIHSDNEYDIAVTKRYEPMLHGIVPVSSELCATANRVLPWRAEDIEHIPYCVQVPSEPAVRASLRGRPLRIVYTGRLEGHQKRAGSLPHIARWLSDAGLDFEFRIVGDGPMADEVAAGCSGLPQVELVGAVPPEEVGAHLQWADLWVMPSRYEGQSVAMLEAMAHGCVPVVTRVRSGAQDAVIDGETGLSVDSEWNMPNEMIAERMGNAIISLRGADLSQIAVRTHRLALERHSVNTHIDSVERLIARIHTLPPRPWPADVRASYSAPQSELDGSTPADAPRRMLDLLNTLAGKRVVLYCSGQHTRDVSAAVEASDAQIVGIIDDDPAKAGQGLIGYPIYPSSMIPQLDATDAVISSWIYEDTIWLRRAEIESLGVTLHRLYPVECSRTAALARLRP